MHCYRGSHYCSQVIATVATEHPYSLEPLITNSYLPISTPVCVNLIPSKNAVKFDKSKASLAFVSGVNMLSKLVCLLLCVELTILEVVGK